MLPEILTKSGLFYLESNQYIFGQTKTQLPYISKREFYGDLVEFSKTSKTQNEWKILNRHI